MFYALAFYVSRWFARLLISTYILIYKCICIYVCMYAYIHVCMYAYVHVCMHTCMYLCMYVCIYDTCEGKFVFWPPQCGMAQELLRRLMRHHRNGEDA